MQFLMDHGAAILAISYALVSEALAIMQYMKYPTNSGVGGVLAGMAKFLQLAGAQPIPPASSSSNPPKAS